MSLIDQALKKTQSSLKENKPDESTPEQPKTHTHAHTPFARKYVSKKLFVMPFINRYWIMGTLSLFILAFAGFEIHAHFSSIRKRYVNFYGNLFPHSPVHKKQTPIISTKPIVLDGTIKMGAERVALINGHLYHAGESINGYKIKTIRYNYIILQNISTHQTRTVTPTLVQ